MNAASRLILGVVASLLPAALVQAQLPVNEDCDLGTIRSLTAEQIGAGWLARHPDSVYHHMIDRMAADEWLFLVDSIIRDFQKESDTAAAEEHRRFRAQLDTLRDELAFAQGQPDFSKFRGSAALVRQIRFRLNRDTEEDRFWLFRGFPHEITITEDDSQDMRRSLCWRALAVDRLLSAYGAPARLTALQRLDEAVGRWDNYGKNGQSQFPWELALNSAFFDRRAIDPPGHQIVLLHPAVGVELAGPEVDRLRRLDVVTLEPLGMIWYNRTRSFYYGFSTIVSVPDDADIGVGGLVHLGKLAKLGFIFRGRDDAGVERNGVLLSVDLYRFLSAMPSRIREAKEEALQGARKALIAASDPVAEPGQP